MRLRQSESDNQRHDIRIKHDYRQIAAPFRSERPRRQKAGHDAGQQREKICQKNEGDIFLHRKFVGSTKTIAVFYVSDYIPLFIQRSTKELIGVNYPKTRKDFLIGIRL